ncbi:putative wall-associated receptor kinase [Trifolium repens]|nr:putative wall-associated receptor kinase [Trifolium repens]
MHPLIMFAALSLLVEAVASDQLQQVLPGCNYTCGDIQIPYPFGIGNSTTQDHTPCYMDSKFNLTCVNNSTLISGKRIQVLDINPQGQMVMKFFVSHLCTNSSNNTEEANTPFLRVPSLTVSSTENKFITVGCDSYGYLNSNFKGATYSTGCLTRCYDFDPKMVIGNNTGKCTGLGCCQIDIPPLMKNITIQTFKFPTSTTSQKDCSYSFIAKQGSYNFSVDHINNLPNQTFPLVVNWAITSESCQIAQTTTSYACKENSECVDDDLDYDGYRCKCSDGFEGNPYLPGGCTDIDECATNLHACKNSANCNNTAGNYTCFCPVGQTGDGTKEGGCQLPDGNAYPIVPTVLGVGAALIVLFVGIIFTLIYQKRKLTKLKEKFFRQNGGSILEQKLLQRKDSSQIANIFKC